MSYLSRYSTNLLGITAPQKIQVDVIEPIFRTLFSKWISSVAQKENTFDTNVEQRLSRFINDTLKVHTNINLKITESIVPGIIFPMSISSIGKNKLPFLCEMLDFDQNVNQAKARINTVIQLNQVFAEHHKEKSVIYFVANEPETQNLGHSIWSNLRDWKTVNVVTEAEVEEIEQYVIEHEVQPIVLK